MPGSESREVQPDIDDRKVVVDLLGWVRVVSVMRVEEVFWICSGTHELSLKVDDFGREPLHSLLEGFLFRLVVGRVSRRGFRLVVSGPRPWPATLLYFDGFSDDIVNDVSLLDFAGSFDVAGNVDEDVGNDRSVEIENGFLLVVLLGRQAAGGLVEPE
jgi:hypothetical protein